MPSDRGASGRYQLGSSGFGRRSVTRRPRSPRSASRVCACSTSASLPILGGLGVACGSSSTACCRRTSCLPRRVLQLLVGLHDQLEDLLRIHGRLLTSCGRAWPPAPRGTAGSRWPPRPPRRRPSASCLVEPERTSPAANTPGTLVIERAIPVTISPRSSRSTCPSRTPVLGSRPMKTKHAAGVELLALAASPSPRARSRRACRCRRPSARNSTTSRFSRTSIFAWLFDLVLQQLVGRQPLAALDDRHLVDELREEQALLEPAVAAAEHHEPARPLVEGPVARRAEVDPGADQVVLTGSARPPVGRSRREQRRAGVVVVAGGGLDVDSARRRSRPA